MDEECHLSNIKQRVLRPSRHQPQHLSPAVHPEGTQEWNGKNTGPRELRCISKEWLLKLKNSYLPIHRKMLNSLTWDIWFYLISNNLLMLWLSEFVFFFLNKLLYILAALLPLQNFPSELSSCLLELSLQYAHQIQHNPQFFVEQFFSGQQNQQESGKINK